MGTKLHPGAFDCYASAAPDEPLFVLLARDRSAPLVTRVWAACRAVLIILRVKPATDWPMVREALACARSMRAWRGAPRRAVVQPDVPAEMSIARARAITGAVCDRSFHHMGLKKEVAPLDGVSLADMLRAAAMVRVANDHAPFVDGRKRIEVVPDDRLIAAAYTLEHMSPGASMPGRKIRVTA